MIAKPEITQTAMRPRLIHVLIVAALRLFLMCPVATPTRAMAAAAARTP